MRDIIKINSINNFRDFVNELRIAGMSTGGANNEGVFSLCDYYGDSICWHTENKETDPWEWRMGVLSECNDIAYGKLFFKKSGFITKEWYPYFYAVRRGHTVFEEAYDEGTMSRMSSLIYDLICQHKELPYHELKQLAGISKEEKSSFERAMVELQMKMYITMCGRQRKQSKQGEEYGWSSTVFCLVEDFFEKEVFDKAEGLSREEAYEDIEQHIFLLNPEAIPKKVKKFIEG